MNTAPLLRTLLPSGNLIALVFGAATVCAALAFTSLRMVAVALPAAGCGALLLVALACDAWITVNRWRSAPLILQRRLPAAFAIGRTVVIRLSLENAGSATLRGRLFELADPSLDMPSMPLRFEVGAGRRQDLEFEVKPTARGTKCFAGCQIMLRSAWGLLELNLHIGGRETRRVFPNFEHQSGLGWLAERRSSDLGLKAVRRRGMGTDFDQLVEYRAGDPIRHVDWKATLRHGRPITRKFRDDRDQCVMFLLDCGRRMRSDDTAHGVGAGHFDQSLNALMYLAFVALKFGDAVGAMTFGAAADGARRFAPRKGHRSLNALMAALSDVEPSPTFSDYAAVAADLMQRQHKRALVVLVTNCRDEDAPELSAALRLLCTRHLVVLANLREPVVDVLADQAPTTVESGLEAAAALEYRQQRSDMMRRFALGRALTIDCEPERLGIELVNRYTILKRTGAI